MPHLGLVLICLWGEGSRKARCDSHQIMSTLAEDRSDYTCHNYEQSEPYQPDSDQRRINVSHADMFLMKNNDSISMKASTLRNIGRSIMSQNPPSRSPCTNSDIYRTTTTPSASPSTSPHKHCIASNFASSNHSSLLSQKRTRHLITHLHWIPFRWTRQERRLLAT